MAAAGQTPREVLARYGLAQSVQDEFVRMLDEFDAAVAPGNDGVRRDQGARDARPAVKSASSLANHVVSLMASRPTPL
jgi:hypothetical protein